MGPHVVATNVRRQGFRSHDDVALALRVRRAWQARCRPGWAKAGMSSGLHVNVSSRGPGLITG